MNHELLVDYHEIIECITGALDAKDPYTAGHSQRVSELTLMLCGWLGLSESETAAVHVAAHLHDIGKIGVPDAVLNKEGPLTEDEWEKMRMHPVIGADILSKSSKLKELKDMVLYHHERYDGKGYPYGISGRDIPVGARIIAICDSIDAMTTNRSYRPAKGLDYARKEIAKNIGTMYDPRMAMLMLDHWDEVSDTVNRMSPTACAV